MLIRSVGLRGGGSASATPGGGPDATLFYVEVTIPSAAVGSTLTSFPVYVSLDSLPADFWTNVQTDGGDIRVTESDGLTRCPVELVTIDAGANTGELHFLASSLSAVSDSVFRIYYGAASTLSQPAVTDTYGRNAVWAAYEGVWHLEAYSSGVPDSTGNGHTLTYRDAGFPAVEVAGEVGGGLDFDGSNGNGNDNHTALVRGRNNGLDIANDITYALSAWIKPSSVAPTLQGIAGKLNFGTAFAPIRDEYGIYLQGATVRAQIHDGSTGSSGGVGTITAGAWGHLIAVADGTDLTVYFDGAFDANGSNPITGFTPNTGANNFSIGDRAEPDSGPNYWPFDGVIDEVRARNSDLSADWASVEYANQNDPATFYSVGSQQAA